MRSPEWELKNLQVSLHELSEATKRRYNLPTSNMENQLNDSVTVHEEIDEIAQVFEAQNDTSGVECDANDDNTQENATQKDKKSNVWRDTHRFDNFDDAKEF